MSSKKSLDMFKLITERVKNSHAFDRNLDKVKIISAANGKCKAEFTVAPEHQNVAGTLHGGFSATLVDVISTYALITTEKQHPGVSVDLHVKYLKAAFEGEEVVVDANTIKVGKNLAFLEVTISKKNSGVIIATGAHTKYIGSP